MYLQHTAEGMLLAGLQVVSQLGCILSISNAPGMWSGSYEYQIA